MQICSIFLGRVARRFSATLSVLATLVIATLPLSQAQAANTAPVMSGSPIKTATVGVLYQFQPVASDADGNQLSYSIVNRPGWATFDTATGKLSGTPAVPYTHSNITIRVSDGLATTSLPVFAITVTGTSSTASAPVISGTPTKSATVRVAYSFQPTATTQSGTLTFMIWNKPGWATFSTTTGRLSGTPTKVATHSNIRIGVSNGGATSWLPIFTITVAASSTNSPPTISGTPATSVAVGSSYAFQPTASDPNGDRLTFSIANRPSWANFNTATGNLSGAPTASNVGTYAGVTISVSDGTSSRSLPAFAITVAAAANSPPTITGTPATSVTVGSSYLFQPAASDPNGQTLTFSIANQPNWATFNPATGRLSGTPTAGSVGTYSSIVISVSDGMVARSLPSFSIAVNAIALGSATLNWSAPTQNADGSALTDLAGYRIYYGTSSSALTNVVPLNGTGVSTYVIGNLAPATYYFAVTAVNSRSVESDRSVVVSKAIP